MSKKLQISGALNIKKGENSPKALHTLTPAKRGLA
jgi:hypothetical protein